MNFSFIKRKRGFKNSVIILLNFIKTLSFTFKYCINIEIISNRMHLYLYNILKYIFRNVLRFFIWLVTRISQNKFKVILYFISVCQYTSLEMNDRRIDFFYKRNIIFHTIRKLNRSFLGFYKKHFYDSFEYWIQTKGRGDFLCNF